MIVDDYIKYDYLIFSPSPAKGEEMTEKKLYKEVDFNTQAVKEYNFPKFLLRKVDETYAVYLNRITDFLMVN